MDQPSLAPPCQTETVSEASEEPEECVYYTPPSSEFNVSDVSYLPDFAINTTPPTEDPTTSDASSLREEVSSLLEELEEAKRENRDLNAELADYGRSLWWNRMLTNLGYVPQRLIAPSPPDADRPVIHSSLVSSGRPHRAPTIAAEAQAGVPKPQSCRIFHTF